MKICSNKNRKTLLMYRVEKTMGGIVAGSMGVISHSNRMEKDVRNHEFTHNPPPTVPEVKLTKEQPDKIISKSTQDDMYWKSLHKCHWVGVAITNISIQH